MEGFVNYVGGEIDPDWLTFSKGMSEGSRRKPGIKDKIARVYAKRGLKANLTASPISDVLTLFTKRGFLMHPTLDVQTFDGAAPPADILEMVSEDFPPSKVERLALDFIRKLLKD